VLYVGLTSVILQRMENVENVLTLDSPSVWVDTNSDDSCQ